MWAENIEDPPSYTIEKEHNLNQKRNLRKKQVVSLKSFSHFLGALRDAIITNKRPEIAKRLSKLIMEDDLMLLVQYKCEKTNAKLFIDPEKTEDIITAFIGTALEFCGMRFDDPAQLKELTLDTCMAPVKEFVQHLLEGLAENGDGTSSISKTVDLVIMKALRQMGITYKLKDIQPDAFPAETEQTEVTK